MAKKGKGVKAGTVNVTSDIVQIMTSRQEGIASEEATGSGKLPGSDTELLKSIDSTLKQILQSGPTWSQSDAQNMMPGRKFGPDQRDSRGTDKSRRDMFGRSNKNSLDMDSFNDGLKQGLMDALVGSDFKDSMRESLDEFAHEFGLEIEDIPNQIGKELGQQAMNAFKQTDLGKSISSKVDAAKEKAMSSVKDAVLNARNANQTNMAAGADLAKEAASNLGDDALKAVASGADDAAAAFGKMASGSATAASNMAAAGAGAAQTTTMMGSLASSSGSVAAALGGPVGLAVAAGAVVAGFLLITAALHILGPAIEGTKALFEASSKAANRYNESRKKNVEEAQKRMQADMRTVIEEPFKILEEAAQAMYQVWDQQLRTISATQGYNKADVQDLISVYANRLRDEGLTRVISSGDITANLSKTLESGLSGQVAEEFAYLATKLNAAIPTQDFFDYADVYASLAANAIKNGQSQSQAIAYANSQMEQFASNVLYASRQLSGGFSTGLRDAKNLFESSAQIATAAKTNNTSEISGVLTAVSAIVGAIAPDLSSSLVESVVKAATGGNSSELVALRSLAGINASNTEFLRALAADPKAVFTELFSNLARMQNMSNDNFMEVAEGLSEVFGISMDAFARVDFNYLAQAIDAMNINNASLSENIKLLASGQTTTNAEQMKMAQINEYMLDEGLAYVLDNEAARAIQQHMWDEQLARELMEASYAVELQGSALQFLEGISQTVNNIINLLNPVAWAQKLVNLAGTHIEGKALEADYRQMLELGKVGQGRRQDIQNLMSTNKDLNLTPQLVELFGGVSLYGAASGIREAYNEQFVNTHNNLTQSNTQFLDFLGNKISAAIAANNMKNSMYGWANIGKSVAKAITATPQAKALTSSSYLTGGTSTTAAASAKAAGRFQEFVDSVQSFVDSGKSYEDWKATASKFGISDFSDALEQYGRTEAELKGFFQAKESQKGAQDQVERLQKEEAFWVVGTQFWTITHPEWTASLTKLQETQIDYQKQLVDLVTAGNSKLSEIFKNDKDFVAKWTDFYINRTFYSKATNDAYKVQEELSYAEKQGTGDAVLKLAEALTSNNTDLKDPIVQTNVLLSQILLVAQSIMQQNNTSSGALTLPSSMAAQALGLIGTTE